MADRIGIFGISGQARDLADIAFHCGLTPVYVVRNSDEASDVDSIEVILEADVLNHTEMSFAIGIGDPLIRKKIYERFGDRLNFRNLIHPHASFGRGQIDRINQSQGVVVCAGVRMSNSIQVGDFTLFNMNATVGHDCVIEDFVTVSPGACISGNVHVGEAAWIGTGAIINQGRPERKLQIGCGAMIGAGAVVLGDCEPAGTYVGVPARRIK
ncbi:acetyltransferase [Achromobacter insolitus]|uniref:acetyltransferase n=1 Tax=Achromobacter insolitus TaxID=217204 RepID=UPI0027E15E8C|nr:acetyltransferase [Achromobacter insolitus]MDQ6212206.1 acetyltransferase [Achromobacter insolitus]